MIRSFDSKTPEIDSSAFIDSSACVIGDVSIGAQASIWPMAVVRGDIQSIHIGARSNIQDGTVIHVTHDGPFCNGGRATRIGCDVIVGHKAMLHACTLEDSCSVGMGAIILDGACVQSHAMIAAGSLVPPGRVCDGGFLWVGNPVKKIRPLTKKELDFLPYSANYYVELAQRHKGES
jgi:carbonic anhydrase/acetyltransferase-like protein (isoleucine patch superfamily)